MTEKIDKFKLIKSNIIKIAFQLERETEKMRNLIESLLVGDFEPISVMYRIDRDAQVVYIDYPNGVCDIPYIYADNQWLLWKRKDDVAEIALIGDWGLFKMYDVRMDGAFVSSLLISKPLKVYC